MGKLSISPTLVLLLSLEVRARYRLGHVASLSTGDGWRYGQTGPMVVVHGHAIAYRQIDPAVIDYCRRQLSAHEAVAGNAHQNPPSPGIPLILYSPVSWLVLRPMLNAGDALDPTVSTLSNPGCATSGFPAAADEPGRWFSSAVTMAPGRREKGLRMGIVND